MTTSWEGKVRERLGRAAVTVPPPWQPPQLGAFPQGAEALAFDPSLSSTGWAWLRVAESRVQVLNKGTIRSATAETGFMGTYQRAHCIARELAGIFRAVPLYVNHETAQVYRAWEAPSVGGGHRTESSLIAGYLVWEASRGAGTAVQANHVSSLLCGNPRHDKKEIAAAVARYIPESATRQWNEHERDAAAVGLARLLDVAAAIINK